MTLYQKTYIVVGFAIIVIACAISTLAMSIAEAKEIQKKNEVIDSLNHVILIERGMLNEEI